MDKKKEMEVEWYREHVVPVYKEMVTLKLAREAVERNKRLKKEGIDEPNTMR